MKHSLIISIKNFISEIFICVITYAYIHTCIYIDLPNWIRWSSSYFYPSNSARCLYFQTKIHEIC